MLCQSFRFSTLRQCLSHLVLVGLLSAALMPGCSASKLYDPDWPPRRGVNQMDQDFRGTRDTPVKKSFFQDSRSAEIESDLGME